MRRDQEARIARAIADFKAARPPGGIDLARLYEENLIDGIVYERRFRSAGYAHKSIPLP